MGPRWTADERPGPRRSPDGPSVCTHGEQILRARGWAGGLRGALLAWKERAGWGLSEALVGSLATFGEELGVRLGYWPSVFPEPSLGVEVEGMYLLKGP